MQGIYQGYPVLLHDVAWTVVLDMVQKEDGKCSIADALELLKIGGGGEIWLL